MTEYFLAVFVSFGGLFVHWLKRWLRKQTDKSFKRYMIENASSTFMSLVGVIGTASAVIASATVDFSDPQFIALLITTGYAADSVLNK